MNILDLIIIGIVILFIVIGAIKGLIKTVIGLVAWIVSIILAFALCKSLAGVIEPTKLGISINEWASGLFTSEITNISITGTEAEMLEQTKILLQEMNIPQIMINPLANKIVEMLPENGFHSIKEVVSTAITNWILVGGSFIAILVASRVLFEIIKALASKAAELPVVKTIDKVAGAGIYLVLCYILLSLVASLYTFVKPLEFMEKANNYVDESKIAPVIIENNVFDKLFAKQITTESDIE